MRNEWPNEIVRLLENWSMWCANDRRPVDTVSPYPAYRLANRGKRAANIIPIIGIEAERADRIIRNMVPRYQQPLRLHYLWVTRSQENKARACNCCVETYLDRLDTAHSQFRSLWHGRIPLAENRESA